MLNESERKVLPIILPIIIAVFLFCAYGVFTGQDPSSVCESKGGEYFYTDNSGVCISKSVILE